MNNDLLDCTGGHHGPVHTFLTVQVDTRPYIYLLDCTGGHHGPVHTFLTVQVDTRPYIYLLDCTGGQQVLHIPF
ncbi:hypothetical protein DPMN_009487 [Dreissena polymorpha]|uniref:Uncharacterized protein n=1 Tax=Dreissena polymorpha TaxID=45954 RepID=A0A9D4S063_DREPO|nr:hypothetical protein DPMN_009487 [Dreissena polymorpha]